MVQSTVLQSISCMQQTVGKNSVCREPECAECQDKDMRHETMIRSVLNQKQIHRPTLGHSLFGNAKSGLISSLDLGVQARQRDRKALLTYILQIRLAPTLQACTRLFVLSKSYRQQSYPKLALCAEPRDPGFSHVSLLLTLH